MALYLIFSDGILTMFGGTVNAETFRHSKEYFFYIILGIPFYMFGQAMNPVIRADGSPKFAMVSTLAGAVALVIVELFPGALIGIFLQAMGKALESTILSMVREVLFGVGFALLLLLLAQNENILKMANGNKIPN